MEFMSRLEVWASCNVYIFEFNTVEYLYGEMFQYCSVGSWKTFQNVNFVCLCYFYFINKH